MEEESAIPLPDELISEILVRLPVKSLVRFNIVSRSWFALIRSPYFVNQHTKRDHKETMLLLSRRKKDDIILSLRDPDSSDFNTLSPKFPVPCNYSKFNDLLDIIGPCNGLFFLWYRNASMFCNPALREFKVLPPCPCHLFKYQVYNQGHGFWFDPLTGSYKVIGMYNVVDAHHKVELFDSRSNCWRMIDSTHKMLSYIRGNSGIFFKGACHWVTSYYYSGRPGVLYFDVSTEVFRHCEFPKWDGSYEKYRRLSILRDHLTLVFYWRSSRFSRSTSIDIWVMEEYGMEESWARTLKIEVNSRIRDVFFFWNDEWILVDDDEGGPKFLLDLRNGELGRAFTFHRLPFRWGAAIFKESLISLDDVICNVDQDG